MVVERVRDRLELERFFDAVNSVCEELLQDFRYDEATGIMRC